MTATWEHRDPTGNRAAVHDVRTDDGFTPGVAFVLHTENRDRSQSASVAVSPTAAQHLVESLGPLAEKHAEPLRVLALMASRLGLDIESGLHDADRSTPEAKLLHACTEWAIDGGLDSMGDRVHPADQFGDVQPSWRAHDGSAWVWANADRRRGDGATWSVGRTAEGVRAWVDEDKPLSDPDAFAGAIWAASRREAPVPLRVEAAS